MTELQILEHSVTAIQIMKGHKVHVISLSTLISNRTLTKIMQTKMLGYFMQQYLTKVYYHLLTLSIMSYQDIPDQVKPHQYNTSLVNLPMVCFMSFI